MEESDTSTEERLRAFQSISIKGFRKLLEAELDLRPLTVLIGANGVGKTSLLDALLLLGSSAEGSLESGISKRGGIGALMTSGLANTITFDLLGPVSSKHRYSLRLLRRGTGYVVSYESLSKGSVPLVEADEHYFRYSGEGVPSWPSRDSKRANKPQESALSQAPQTFEEADQYRQALGSVICYHVLDVGEMAPIRLPQVLKPAGLPGENGEDLISCLHALKNSQTDRYEAIEDALRAAFPAFERLEFPAVAAGTVAMTWKDKRFASPFFMNQLSEGTLRFLWLATLLASPSLPVLTLIDEPEVSLHPELLHLLVDLMREATRRTQLIVATHSDSLVRFLNPNEVVVMNESDASLAQFEWADSLKLDEWLAEYSLDELWRMGRLGGRA